MADNAVFTYCVFGDDDGDTERFAITNSELADGVEVEPGFYLLYSTKACRWKEGEDIDVSVTTSTGKPLPAGMFFGPVDFTKAARSFINVISTDGNGVFEMVRVWAGASDD